MMWLSQNQEDLSERYDVIIVGSGYGGAVAASRLARLGFQVCLLERGREIVPGQYPNNTEQFLKEVHAVLPSEQIGAENALFDVRCYRDIQVVTGSGLGGTSLIDAGVCLRPDLSLLQDLAWPEAIRNDPQMPIYYQKAETMLCPSPYPLGFPLPPKFCNVEQAVKETIRDVKTSRPKLLINFDSLPNGLNPAGVRQNPCTLCGNCLTGCNEGAKNTLMMNYLPDAKRHGARLFTRMQVLSIQQEDTLWRVFVKRIREDNKKEKPLMLRADRVILAAGTLGTTEILLRSEEKGLKLSNALGHRFSGNGNTIGVVFNTNAPMNAVGLGSHGNDGEVPVGPATAGMMAIGSEQPLKNDILLSDLTFPGAFGKWLPFLLSSLAKTAGAIEMGAANEKEGAIQELFQKETRIIQSRILGSGAGAVHHTSLLFVTGHDESAGRIIMEKDRIKILWPGIHRQPKLYRTHEMLKQIAETLEGYSIPNPIWHERLGNGIMTWHPLGGAVMADDASAGVVNHKGQVFSGGSGVEVYSGLYVMDGSVIPRSLGVPPLLTICALAERSCSLLEMEKR